VLYEGRLLARRHARLGRASSGAFGDHPRWRGFSGRLMITAAEGASRWMFAPELESGEVVSILRDWTLSDLDLWVIYPSGRRTSTKARVFMKWFETIITEWKPGDRSPGFRSHKELSALDLDDPAGSYVGRHRPSTLVSTSLRMRCAATIIRSRWRFGGLKTIS
jgi:hypothetical protein